MVREHYRHTQVNYWLALITALVLILLSWFLTSQDAPLLPSAVVLATGFLTALTFWRLTVVVDDHAVRFWFGWGWPRGSFVISEVREARAVRNPWWYGWGFRWYSGGWLFNVAGRDAVELRMRNGRRYRIGTDEPKRLETAIMNTLNPIRTGGS